MNCIDTCCPCEIKEHCPTCPDDVAYYTEIIVSGEFKIPTVKPPSEKIIEIHRNISLTKAESLCIKLDNGCISGCKVLVTGTIRLGIEYSANVPEQNVHFMHVDLPFQGLIMGGPCNKPIPLGDCDLKNFHLHICVEHIQVHQLACKTFEKVIVLLLWLERKHHLPPCPPTPCPPLPCPPTPCPRDLSSDCCSPPPCPPNSCPPDLCKEISINHILTIPCSKPPVECILTNTLEIEVTNAFVIKTPIVSGPCHLPMRKVIITGKALITVKYAAHVPDQQVHIAEFCIPFKNLIEWHNGPPPGTPICIEITEEHFQVELLDQCHLFTALLIRVDVFENHRR